MSNANSLVPQNRSPLMTDDQKLRELIRLVTDGLSSEHSLWGSDKSSGTDFPVNIGIIVPSI